MAVCCVCGHDLCMHIPESMEMGPYLQGWWRCHCLGGDGYQCECRLLHWADHHEESKLSDYDLDKRAEELIKEELGEARL